MSGQVQVGDYGITISASATSIAGGTTGAVPYQSSAGTTSFAYPNTSMTFYLDGTRTDSYTPNGTALLPYQTLTQLASALSSVTGPFVINVTPVTGGYAYTGNISYPAYPMAIIGNGATYTITGNVTLNSIFYIQNLNASISGTLTYAATSTTESVRICGSLTCTGGIFTSGYEHFFDMSVLLNTLITVNAGATPVFTNVVGTPRWKSATSSTASTVLTIIDCEALATGAYTNVDMSNGGLLIARGLIVTNNNSVVNINLSGSSAVSATVFNALSSIEAGQVTCGSSYTNIAPDGYMPLLSGTALHFSGALELVQYSLTAQASSISATTLYTTLAAGIYRITASVQTTTAGSAGTVLVTVKGTASATADLTSLGSTQSLSTTFYSATPVALQYTTTVAGNSGGAYRVDAFVERLG
jgi:hypothetical protein